ncbi:AAA family ATPase [Paracoccus sp. 1_MG-2023]|uniref:AAA family ATPase n=1 Tax=unclassified Paracoccus (in: a-proteobacteria) TaxID=2688777 RepID=UPI001C096CEF|nr:MULTISPECIES: AAA family ATPase [unclassified Paracoccus (in: a-proteobacteria)]MBU2957720.1 chromosome segregation protein SMC [Paracoccus sp. C2R09]MDO6667432.1 AAA family ATPase [Paracoccus sp. 1_MG-2023]
MKLRAIALTNIRQFTATMRIDGIGDGLNVLSEPNEFGKSTIFDALQAVFFKPHGSGDKEIKALRPHSGGAPEITVEVETADGRFTITKRWLQKPTASVSRDGRPIAQSDQAEDWIARALGQDGGGPAGLIWVRQGMTSLTDGSNKEKAAALDARRDLLSSVGEEVEAMTGGRRMDAALQRCRDELGVLATATGRPKMGGPWKAAQDQVAALTAERDDLQRLTQELHAALDARRKARRTSAELTDADEVALRNRRLETARAEHATAERHGAEVERLAREVETRRLRATAAQARLDEMRKVLGEQAECDDLIARAEGEAGDARAAHGAALDALSLAQKDQIDAAARLEGAETERARVERAQAARDNADRRRDLERRIAQAEEARQAMEAAKARIHGLTRDALSRIETLAADLAAATAARNAAATQITARYDAAARLTLNGDPLPDGSPVPLAGLAMLDLPGIGTLEIRPAEAAADDHHGKAQATLRDALDMAGVRDLAEARHSATLRANAERDHAEARALLSGIAPEGMEVLRAQLARLPVAEDAADDTDPSAAIAAHEKAREVEKTARDALALCAEAANEARVRMVRADAMLDQARDRHARATQALAGFDGDIPTLSTAADDTRDALKLAEAEHDAALKSAPDLAAAAAALRRAQSIDEGARTQIGDLRQQLAALEERIRRAAGDAVEERLAAASETLAAATRDLDRLNHEVAVLTRLESALVSARSAARDRYFEPVARELRPLLGLLWPDAELTWAEDSLLPDCLIRDGMTEPLDILSGGTQEQIALLVRLAFARMLGAAGRTAPVILDDALVFTDDARIERMFDALHRQAADLQIIVLTCRQRAFRDLGGHALRLTAA